MKKILLYSILLILIFFFPAKTVDMIIDKNSDDEKREEQQWVEVIPEDIMEIEKVTSNTQPATNSGWWRYPDVIYTTKRSGDDLLVLVNKEYKLPSTYAPSDLVKASNSGIRRGESYYLRNILIPDLTNMVNDAKSQGIDLSIVSAYRSYQTQVNTYNNWLSKNNNNVDYVDTFSARPGHSQHQLGTAIDFSSSEIGDKLGDSFANTKASNWLIDNAYRYGFVISFPKGFESITGYKFESWHYRYIGTENAKDMINKGQILELYLESHNP
ncbi:MAG TPA: M15 family metallopeptidase [Candidatus Dojkabacteria bacterium]|nr:M15 family metallopeptidase [Candidatus Dojkabacteria bacterium]